MALSMKTHPLTGAPIVPIGYRRDGRPIYPIMGASEPAPEPTPTPTPEPTPTPTPGDAFPANTPLEQMTVQQREAYWKHQARKHEDRVKAFGAITPEQLADLRTKAEQHDALERELMSDKDKAIAQAKQDAETTAASSYVPQIVGAKLDAAAARKGLSEDSLKAALEFVDTAKFLDASGQVDAAKVNAFIEGITPAKGTQPQPRGPVLYGGGTRPNASTPSGEQGRLMAEKRFGKK